MCGTHWNFIQLGGSDSVFFLLHFLSLQSTAIEKSEEATTLFCNHLHFFLLNIRLLEVIGLVCNFRWLMKNRWPLKNVKHSLKIPFSHAQRRSLSDSFPRRWEFSQHQTTRWIKWERMGNSSSYVAIADCRCVRLKWTRSRSLLTHFSHSLSFAHSLAFLLSLQSKTGAKQIENIKWQLRFLRVTTWE